MTDVGLAAGHNYRKPKPKGEDLDPIEVLLEEAGEFDPAADTIQVELSDGSVEISFGAGKKARESENFDDNLAELIPESELSVIAENLLRCIEQDNSSRDAWLQNMSNGISLLGLEIKNPRGAAASGTNSEGVSTVDHPLLLEAVLRFQANARGELLPTDGPVKVRNDGEGDAWKDRLATALEKDLNHYLTRTAKEYVPDTDRMLFMLGFCGIAFKKGYHDPIRRRPVIESIDAKDLIVSNAATNLYGAGRVTHRIMMRPSILKRMQLVGAYRDVRLPTPGTPMMRNPVEERIDRIQGIEQQGYQDPEDQDRELYECYCEIDVAGFEHKDDDGNETGLPLPYKVTIDREARSVLEIRRNWEEDDELCMPRNRIIAYMFVPGLGFYGIGLLNILGNATKTATAAWRLMIDAGMFSNFPGFLYQKSMAKQLTNNFMIRPGTGMPIDGTGDDIRKSVMQLPYRDPSAVFIQLIDNVVTTAQRVGGTAETQIGEGKQDAPVGTTLALIEQATKIMNAVHKRLHNAQSQEFEMLKDLLKEDPSALWRHNKKSKSLKIILEKMGQGALLAAEEAAEDRKHQLFVAALNDCDLVPAADPNTASSTERYLKIMALKQIQMGNPRINPDEVDLRAMHILGVDDAESLFMPLPPPGSAPPDPQALAAQAKMVAAQASVQGANVKAMEAQSKGGLAQAEAAAKQQEAAAKLRIAELGVHREAIIHQKDSELAQQELAAKSQDAERQRQHDMATTAIEHQKDTIQAHLEAQHNATQEDIARRHEAELEQRKREHEHKQGDLERAHEVKQSELDRKHEIQKQKIQAKAKAKPAVAKKKGVA